MLELPNNCHSSDIAVTPKNWKKLSKVKSPWRIHCRFYDPSRMDEKGKVKTYQITIKQMNRITDIVKRKEETQNCIDELHEALLNGYNPFEKKIIREHGIVYDVEPTTLFIEALRTSLSRLRITPVYRKHIGRYIIPNVQKAARMLGYERMRIKEIKRRHIIFILDHLRKVNKGFTDNTFNRFRTDLKILFKELLKIEAVETNIINDIEKIEVDQHERNTLTPSQRKYVNEYLKQNYPEFHRFLHIFFHSGSRITELLKLKGSDVDLQAQKFKREIKKGRKTRIEWTPIKNIALPYWTEIVQKSSENQYLFSFGLIPGDKKIQPYQITKRWYRLIKQKGIATADFYSLKHLNSTEMVDHLSEQAAATLNGHTTTAMVRKIYDTKQKDREHEKIKGVNNAF